MSQSTQLAKEIFSPIKDNVVVNDRWGTGVMGNHGGFLTYSDNFNPGKFSNIIAIIAICNYKITSNCHFLKTWNMTVFTSLQIILVFFFDLINFTNTGHLLPRKWENCMTLDKYSWGFRKNLEVRGSDLFLIWIELNSWGVLSEIMKFF